MINLTGTETDKNLRNAFSGESEAAMKYSFFTRRQPVTKDISRSPISFRKLQIMNGNMRKSGSNSSTVSAIRDNLYAAAAGERYEWNDMYAGLQRRPAGKGSQISP